MMEAKKPPIRVKIEPRWQPGQFGGWGLFIALVDRPYYPSDIDFQNLDGTFVGFGNDYEYAHKNVLILSEQRSFANLGRPLELID
jgi:hypothetical protein